MSDLFVTVGEGLTNTQGRLLKISRVEQVLGGNDPLRKEQWYAFCEWEENRRASLRWKRACAVPVDLDFRNKAGEKIPSAPFEDVLRKAFDEGIILGSHAYMSPHGFRVIFLLDAATTSRELYKQAVEGAHHAIASVVEQIVGPDVVVDADTVAMKDFARLSWFPRTIDEKGVRRTAQLWTSDDEDTGEAVRFRITDLIGYIPEPSSTPSSSTPPPAAPVVMSPALAATRAAVLQSFGVAAEPQPETIEGVAGLEAARLTYLQSEHASLDKILGMRPAGSRKCPLCEHDGCFDSLRHGPEVVPGAYICRSTNHVAKCQLLGRPVGIPCRDGQEYKFDALDLHAWKSGTSATEILTNLKFYRSPFVFETHTERGTPVVYIPNRAGTEDRFVSLHAFAEATFKHIPAGTFYRYNGSVGTLERDGTVLRHVSTGAAAMSLIAGRFVAFKAVRLGRDGQAAGSVSVNVGRSDAEVLVAYATLAPNVRELRGIVSHPGVAGDFQPLVPGWNEASGFYYDEPNSLKGMAPARLSPQQRRAFLEDYLVDFLPVLRGPDLANAIGLMVTAMIRPALVNMPVPMHVAMSPLEGSGKSILCDLFVGYGVTGRTAANMMLSNDLNENAKTLYAFSASGATCINLDNIQGGSTVDDSLLASMLTRATITARVLGTSTMREQPNLFVPMMTGNNISFSPEMTRRVVPINFNPTETIYQRTFRHDAQQHVERCRRKLTEILLGAIVEWRDAGKPGHSSNRELAGFRAWSRSVGGIVQLLGFEEWLAGVKEWQQSDRSNPLGAALRSLLAAWHADTKLRKDPCGVNEIWPLIADNPAALGIVATTERGQRIALGKRLREMEDRPDLKPFRIVRDGMRNHSVAYRVVKDEDLPLDESREPGQEG